MDLLIVGIVTTSRIAMVIIVGLNHHILTDTIGTSRMPMVIIAGINHILMDIIGTSLIAMVIIIGLSHILMDTIGTSRIAMVMIGLSHITPMDLVYQITTLLHTSSIYEIPGVFT